jgi:hypothetical protein
MNSVIIKDTKKEKIMKKNAKMMVMGLVLVMVFCYASPVLAEEGIGTTSANARLNFRVTVAEFIEFRIGSAGAGNIDEIQFSPSMADIQTPTEIGGAGGDLTGGEVTVRLLSNTSNAVTITAYNPSGTGLFDGGSEYINYASILTTESGSGLTPPILSDAGGNTTVLPAGPNTINTVWSYTYQHVGADPLPGTYTGQATYTASAP